MSQQVAKLKAIPQQARGMAYSDFSLEEAIDQFSLTVAEAHPIIESQPVGSSALFTAILERELPWAIAVGSEIARYSGIIAQVLLLQELWRSRCNL